MAKTRKALTKRNPFKSKRKSLRERVLEKRRNEKDAKRNARQEATIEQVSALRPHLRPLAIDASAVATSGALTLDPTVGAVVGAVTAGGFGVNTALGEFTDIQRRMSYVHMAGAAAWAVLAWRLGLDQAATWLTAAPGVVAASVAWAQSNHTAGEVTGPRPDKTLAQRWNEPETGVLAKVGAEGARMVASTPITNADGVQIGDAYTIDLSGAKVVADDFCKRVRQLEHHMPGKVRPMSVEAVTDEDDANKVVLRWIWVQPWRSLARDPKGETVVEHPIVSVLPELSRVMEAAANRHDDPNAADEEIPPHVAVWLPRSRTIADPVWLGQNAQGAAHYRRNYVSGRGVGHLLFTAKSGAGKTSTVNAEMASIMPCDDVVVWYIDVSTKQGAAVRPWGRCIDWFITDPHEAAEALRAAKRIMDRRSEVWGAEFGERRTPAQVPVLKIIIDEVTSTFDVIDEAADITLAELLKPMMTQGRSQGVQLDMYGQIAEQNGTGTHGWLSVLRAAPLDRAVSRVEDQSALRHALPSGAEVPYNMTSAPEGVVAYVADSEDVADVFRTGYIDTGDDERPGLIPAIASIYAPWRKGLEGDDLQAAGPAYQARDTGPVENPFLTPTELAITHPPVVPATTDDDVNENRATITTARTWIERLMAGEPMSTQEMVAAATADRDVPTDRAERKKYYDDKIAETRARAAEVDAELAELDAATADIGNVPLVELTGGPVSYDETDKVYALAVQMLRQNAGRGITTAELAEAAGAKDRRTAESRLRALARAGGAIRTGKTRNTRWYHPDHVPDGAEVTA